jgi:hypothetical protein
MTDLAELIARLEAATEGSRELDAEIEWIAHPFPEVPDQPGWRQLPHGPQQHVLTVADRYTTSLDAALTLVPEGIAWAVNSAGTIPQQYRAEVDFGNGVWAATAEEWHPADDAKMTLGSLRTVLAKITTP